MSASCRTRAKWSCRDRFQPAVRRPSSPHMGAVSGRRCLSSSATIGRGKCSALPHQRLAPNTKWRYIAGVGLESVRSMQRRSPALAVAMIVSSYVSIPLNAKTIVVRAGWRETSTMLAQPDFRPKLWTQLKSNKKMKGHVSGTTAAGLTLERNGRAILIDRTAIHSIRLVPRKNRGHRHRVLALAGGVPARLGAALGS